MNVSIKTSCFRSKTPPESSCRQSRPDRSSASRGCMRSCTCTGLQVRQFWVFCESVPRQILLLGLPVLPGAATGTQVLQFDKKSGAYHISFNHQRSTKSPSQTQKCMYSKGVTRWRELESTYCVTIISARKTGTWAFFRTPFTTTFRWRIFLKPTGID